MSSLLDILHRTDSKPDQESAGAAGDGDAAPTVELRLAIDNGPLDAGSDDTARSGATQPGDSQGSQPAESISAGPATPVGDATKLLATRQLHARARRNSTRLGVGLAVIVLGAGLATWLLNETSEISSDGSSQFSAPAAASGPVERSAVSAAPASPAPARSASRRATNAPAPARAPATPRAARPDEADTTWFDTPATEDPAADPSPGESGEIRIVRGTTTNPLFAKLSAAWTAFQAADYAGAEALYREVRAADASNVDALLGLAALAARGNRMDEARELYQAVLLAEPRNATAVSALSTLQLAGSRPASESSLKDLLREQPGAANLHFALGLQYVAEGRWPDAQVAFFDAVRNEPANADYAYNLAVSLDHLGQTAPAAAYYQRALELASASALFNADAARDRLAALQPAAP